MSSISLTLGLRGRLLSGTQVTLQGTLFGNNEPGFTFEPWDITTLFQDRAGTTPVTAAGQSVGLRLDKSQGLQIGPELVTNGDFAAGTTGWSLAAGWTVTGGGLSINQVGSTIGASQAFSVVAGRTYLFEFDVTAYTSGTLAFGTQTGATVEFGSVSSARHVRVFGIGGASNSGIRFYSTGAGFVGTIDNVSFKELAGNHQVAVSDAKRGVYGWMPKTGRRNLLTYTEQFDNAVWTKDGATVTANAVTAPDGTLTADTISTGTSTGEHRIYQTAGSSAVHTHTIYAKAGTANFVSLSTGNATYYAVFNLSTGAVSSSVSCTPSIVSVGDGWYRLTVTGSVAMPSFFFVVNVGETAASAVPATGSTGTSKTVHLWGAQLELGSTATAYQRVVSQYDITEAGVPTCYYVQADGVDDAYVTPTITPNTDKVQVFAGVRKLSDAAIGLFVSTGASYASNNGAIVLFSPGSPGLSNYLYRSKGTLSSGLSTPNNYAAPISNIVTGISDISNDFVETRINGVSVVQTLSDQGTGDYQAYPAYIYARGSDGTFPFNGLDFGHAVRFGPNLDAATIARVESLIARNTPEVTL